MRDSNILIVGVGGQGTLLASRILGRLAFMWGKEVKLSEVHGMAQRGGSVVTHVKIGDKVYSPIVAEGDADIIISFEKLEAARYRHFLKKDGILLFNSQEIYPMPVIIGDMTYPDDIEQKLKAEGVSYTAIDALSLANGVGNARTVNTVVMGAFARLFDIPFEEINAAMEAVVPAKALEVNRQALRLGYESVK